jgi:dihydrodipicolinate synthase/N-acetylneuraminate lyase
MKWKGVMPAITTCFTDALRVDYGFMAEHSRWLLDNGCSGIVALGSLGEGATVSFDEKQAILRTSVDAVRSRGPVVASISALTTSEAVALAKSAADQGCDGLMVLPPYVYKGDWREMKTHVAAVFRATSLACMLYNNPIAYGRIFCRITSASSLLSIPTFRLLKNQARTCAASLQFARWSVVALTLASESTMRCWRRLAWARRDGSRAWLTLCLASRWI